MILQKVATIGINSNSAVIGKGSAGTSHPQSMVNNIMEFISIASTGGSAQDFGDLNRTEENHWWTSDSHGGLGGF